MTRRAATSARRKPTGRCTRCTRWTTARSPLDNLGNTTQSGLSVESKVYNLAGTVLDDQTASNITLNGQQVLSSVLTPKVPTTPVETYFVELQLKQNGTLVDRNVYWLSTQKDAVNWSKSLDKPAGVISTYANLTGLQSLPQSSVSATATTTQQAGPDGADLATTVTITNTSSSNVAFLLRADVRRGTATGGCCPATTSYSPRSGRTTTSRCSPASRRLSP